MKQFKQPVSMKVTHKQYKKDLKKPLKKLGYKWGSFMKPKRDLKEEYEYLVTEYGGRNSDIAADCIIDGSKHHIDHYNPELFLAIAGMTEGDEWSVGEWLYFSEDDKLFECLYLTGCNDTTGHANNKYSPQGESYFSFYRKATLEELTNHFTKDTTKTVDNQDFGDPNVWSNPPQIETISDTEVKVTFVGDGKAFCEIRHEPGHLEVTVKKL